MGLIDLLNLIKLHIDLEKIENKEKFQEELETFLKELKTDSFKSGFDMGFEEGLTYNDFIE